MDRWKKFTPWYTLPTHLQLLSLASPPLPLNVNYFDLQVYLESLNFFFTTKMYGFRTFPELPSAEITQKGLPSTVKHKTYLTDLNERETWIKSLLVRDESYPVFSRNRDLRRPRPTLSLPILWQDSYASVVGFEGCKSTPVSNPVSKHSNNGFLPRLVHSSSVFHSVRLLECYQYEGQTGKNRGTHRLSKYYDNKVNEM